MTRDEQLVNNQILDNLNIRVSSLEYKVDRIDTQNCDIKEDVQELKADLKETTVELRKIKEKVMKNGKTKISDWVQILLLVVTVILGIFFGV
jgi:hypothetical protein